MLHQALILKDSFCFTVSDLLFKGFLVLVEKLAFLVDSFNLIECLNESHYFPCFDDKLVKPLGLQILSYKCLNLYDCLWVIWKVIV